MISTEIDNRKKVKKKLVRITTVPISLKVLLRQQLKFMSSYYDVLAVSSPGQLLEDVERNEGVRTSAVSMTRSITPVKDMKALLELYRLFKKEKPSIVHTHTPKAGLLGMIAARLAGVPVRMHTVAGLPLMEATGMKRKMLEFVEKITYKNATKVYPNSSNLAEFILSNKFCRPEKVKVLGNGSSNGIDTVHFQISPDLIRISEEIKNNLQIAEEDFVFIFVGRLVRDKGIEELVEAFRQLKTKHRNIKLLLVGDYEPELDPLSEATHSQIKTDKSILYVGFQQDVRPYYVLSHALAFPSYREGFPNVPMQAGCFGLPCIATDINGCNEIIEHKKNGLIIPAKDMIQLKEAMDDILTDQAMYQEMKSNARDFIVKRYEQKYFWSLLYKEYQDQSI